MSKRKNVRVRFGINQFINLDSKHIKSKVQQMKVICSVASNLLELLDGERRYLNLQGIPARRKKLKGIRQRSKYLLRQMT